MPLKCGIVGLSLVGKTTIFNCFSNARAHTGGAAKANIAPSTSRIKGYTRLTSLLKASKLFPLLWK